MLLGLTETLKETKRIELLRIARVISGVFLISVFLPFIIWLLFYSGILKYTPSFNTDIQEPVAKVVTSNSVGTAFLISPTRMLTARHVVEKIGVGATVQVIFEKAKKPITLTAKVIFIAPSSITAVGGQVPMDYFLSDVAVLEVPEVKDIEPLALGESSSVNDLDEVILIGYPNSDYSITKGNINSQSFQNLDLFKLDATSNPGNSGGPCILKEDNTVVGILVGGSGANYQGENVALKIDNAKKVLASGNVKL